MRDERACLPAQMRSHDDDREAARTAGAACRVLVIGADAALFGLIVEWLGARGCEVIAEHTGDGAAPGPVDVIVIDVPFPRQGGPDLLRRIARAHPGTPVLALSSTFFPRIESDGAVARALGVAGVLPKPVARDALIAAVSRLSPGTARQEAR